jgi:hypothetical protein
MNGLFGRTTRKLESNILVEFKVKYSEVIDCNAIANVKDMYSEIIDWIDLQQVRFQA